LDAEEDEEDEDEKEKGEEEEERGESGPKGSPSFKTALSFEEDGDPSFS